MTKNEVIEKIKYYTVPEEVLNAIDSRLHIYLKEVLDNPTQHNKYEILAVFRFLDFLQREDLEFKSKEVKKFVKFYECLKFPSNKGMQSFKLTPIQVFQFANILGFYKQGGEYRLCRDALLFVPRKFSKTTSVSLI